MKIIATPAENTDMTLRVLLKIRDAEIRVTRSTVSEDEFEETSNELGFSKLPSPAEAKHLLKLHSRDDEFEGKVTDIYIVDGYGIQGRYFFTEAEAIVAAYDEAQEMFKKNS